GQRAQAGRGGRRRRTLADRLSIGCAKQTLTPPWGRRIVPAALVVRTPILPAPHPYGHPAAKRIWKQTKSPMFSTGGIVLSLQFAYESPAAKWLMKQTKSFRFRTGASVEPSQLA